MSKNSRPRKALGALLGIPLLLSPPALAGESFWKELDGVRDQSVRLEWIQRNKDLIEAEASSIPTRPSPIIEAYRTQRWDESGRSGVTGVKLQQTLSRTAEYQKLSWKAELDQIPLRLEKEGLARERTLLALLYHRDRLKVEMGHIGDRRQRLKAIQSFLASDQRRSPSLLLERELIQSLMRALEQDFVKLEGEARLVQKELDIRNWKSNYAMSWPIQANSMLAMEASLPAEDSIEYRMQAVLSQSAERQLKELPEWKEVSLYAGYDHQDGQMREKNVTVGVVLPLPVAGQHNKDQSVLVQKKALAESAKAVERSELAMKASELKARAESLKIQGQSLNRSSDHKLEVLVDEANKNLRDGQISIMQYLEIDRSVHAELEIRLDWKESLVNWWLDACQSQPCAYRQHLGAKS